MYRNEEQRNFARRLRNNSTTPERSLWQALRGLKLTGYKFRRQASIDRYTVDFACFSHKLVVELDGPQHLESEARASDERRTAWLNSRGFRVIRFRNHELDDSVWPVVDAILAALKEQESVAPHPPTLALPAEGRESEESI